MLLLCFVSALLAAVIFFIMRYYENNLAGKGEALETIFEKDDGGLEEMPQAHDQITMTKSIRKLTVGYAVFSLLVLSALSLEASMVFPDHSLISNLKNLALTAFLLIVALIDFRHQIIPNKLVLGALALRLPFYVAEVVTLGSAFWPVLVRDFAALLIPLVMLLIGVLIVKNGLGMGDVKLLIVLSLYLGLQNAIAAVFFTFLAAFVIALILLAVRKKKRKDVFPFAPSVLMGTVALFIMIGI